jgi:microcystin-dependent protein
MNYYLGFITKFAGNFAPAGWALCNGQELDINMHPSLYSLLGTRYGGNGVTTFGLPDLRGRVAVGAGQGSGLSDYTQGQTGGTETVSLQVNNLPAHTHAGFPARARYCYSGNGDTDAPFNNYPAKIPGKKMYAAASNGSQTGLNTSSTGDGLPVNLIQPVLAISFIICIIE